jgi:hypothetical protein
MRAERLYPTNPLTITLADDLLTVEKTDALVKARRLAVAANSIAVAPSHLHGRVTQGQPLPCIALAPLMDQDDDEEVEESRKLRTTLAFICRFGREGMPRDVFRAVMDLVMPSWDPLRRNVPGLDRGGEPVED